MQNNKHQCKTNHTITNKCNAQQNHINAKQIKNQQKPKQIKTISLSLSLSLSLFSLNEEMHQDMHHATHASRDTPKNPPNPSSSTKWHTTHKQIHVCVTPNAITHAPCLTRATAPPCLPSYRSSVALCLEAREVSFSELMMKQQKKKRLGRACAGPPWGCWWINAWRITCNWDLSLFPNKTPVRVSIRASNLDVFWRWWWHCAYTNNNIYIYIYIFLLIIK